MKHLSPAEAWEIFAGEQSVTDFVSYSPGQSIEEMVTEYLDNSPILRGETFEPYGREQVHARLVEYIQSCLSEQES